MNKMIRPGLSTLKYFLWCSLLLLFSCSDDDIIEPEILEPELTALQQEIIDYFTEIALGFEFGSATMITRKWTADIKIEVQGTLPDFLIEELSLIIEELNMLITDDITLSIAEDGDISNFLIFNGSGSEYAMINPSAASFINNNRGLFFVNWDSSQNLNNGNMYVDSESIDAVFQRHLLREELTQSLGLAMDSPQYPESIFQSAWTSTTEYTDLDKELIRLLYHPDVTSGFGEVQIRILLADILSNE